MKSQSQNATNVEQIDIVIFGNCDLKMSNSDSDSDIEYQRSKRYLVTQVLHSLAPGDDDYNDWPCFLLEDATVKDKDGKLANLLDVASVGPLTVEGRLHFEAGDELLQSGVYIPQHHVHHSDTL